MATTYAGGSIGYYGGQIDEISQDMKILCPTHIYATNYLVMKMYQKIHKKISKKTSVMSQAVNWAIQGKMAELKKTASVDSKLYDYTVLAQLKKSSFGNYMKHVITGGGYTQPNVLDFIRV
jgi:long-subunit acyl-CoA synthetase (AMP-forming)